MTRSRPLVLSVLCIFGFVYFALLFLLFILASFYSGWITGVTIKYVPAETLTGTQLLLVFIIGAILHGTAFSGLVLIWNLKKAGYYLLGIPCFMVALYHLLQPQISVSYTIFYILFIFIFGLFYRRLN